MNILRKSILIGFTVLGMAAAHAQDTQQRDHQPNKEQMQARMADMYAKRQARLHDLLKLSAQQEAAWANYQAAIKPAFDGKRMARQRGDKLTAPERLTRALERTKQREAMLATRLQAVTAFYGQLSPAQQTLFDEHSMRGKWGHRGHRGHGHGGHGGQRS